MEKNQLKWYDAPIVEVVELEVQKMLCGSTNVDDWEQGD